MPDYSILIVTYNAAEVISGCLDSILKQKANYEILIVDNNSNDKTVDILQRKYPEIQIHRNSENVGYAAAVNKGFELSSTQYFLILNPDTVLPDRFFEKIDNYLSTNTKTSIAGFELRDAEGQKLPNCWESPSLVTYLFEMFLPYKFSSWLVSKNYHDIKEVESVSGACMLIKSEVFQKLHGFDERFFMYYEDIDFCKRARDNGFKIFFFPDIKVTHLVAKSSWQDMNTFFRNFYKSKLYYAKKHFTKLKYFISFLIIISGIIYKSVIYFISGVLTFNKRLLQLSKYHIFVLPKIVKG